MDLLSISGRINTLFLYSLQSDRTLSQCFVGCVRVPLSSHIGARFPFRYSTHFGGLTPLSSTRSDWLLMWAVDTMAHCPFLVSDIAFPLHASLPQALYLSVHTHVAAGWGTGSQWIIGTEHQSGLGAGAPPFVTIWIDYSSQLPEDLGIEAIMPVHELGCWVGLGKRFLMETQPRFCVDCLGLHHQKQGICIWLLQPPHLSNFFECFHNRNGKSTEIIAWANDSADLRTVRMWQGSCLDLSIEWNRANKINCIF